MKLNCTLPIILMLCFVLPTKCYSIEGLYGDSTFVLSLDPPAHEGNAIVQTLNYKALFATKTNIRIRSFMLSSKDSAALYDMEFKNIVLTEGLGSVNLNFNNNSIVNQADYKFQEILKRFEVLPPGDYVTYLYLSFEDTSFIVSERFNWYVDSALSPFSPLRKDVNKSLVSGSEKKKTLKKVSKPEALNEAQAKAINSQIDRKVARKNGVNLRPFRKNGERQTRFYYKGWFLGYYELLPTPDLKQRINRENMLLKSNPLELVSNDLEGFTSLSSQTKKANKKEGTNEVTGNIDLLSNFSSGQETGSAQDRNFQEVYGDFNTEILKIPVVIEAYYTTQDNNRQAKASYLRVRYDKEKNTSALKNTANGFVDKHEIAQSKGVGYKSVYEQMIRGLIAQQLAEKTSFKNEYGISDDMLHKYNGDVGKMIAELDTATIMEKGISSSGEKGNDINNRKQKLLQNRKKIEDYYSKGEATRKKIDKYEKLLEQYEKQQYLDSAMSYVEIKNVTDNQDASPKQLAKAAQHILPPGKASSFLNSLTKVELGILNSYESDYTMSGQVLKGGALGYDLGFATVSGAMGKTEYISRDGNIDRYNTTMLRADLRPSGKRKIGLVYYTCSPTKQIIGDNDFFKGDSGIPTFKQPASILSVPYELVVTKNLSLAGEGAVSYRKFSTVAKIGNHNTAYKTALIYNIPIANMNASAEWEHVGAQFENSALPFPKAATDRYTLATEATVFRSFLSAGVQFNYLKQETFSTSGRNIKWGFDLRTHSKRFPEVYLSYKPFSTFRSFDDTLSIAQRPMIGSVSIARGSYQIKRKGLAHRIMLTYNRNSSIQEEISYNSTTVQATYMLSTLKHMFNLTLGWMEQPQFLPGLSGNMSSYLGNISYSRNLTEAITAMAGQDIAIASYGLQRAATNAGITYTFKNKPLKLRLLGRYSGFKATELADNETIWSCVLACNWQIKQSPFKSGKTK